MLYLKTYRGTKGWWRGVDTPTDDSKLPLGAR